MTRAFGAHPSFRHSSRHGLSFARIDILGDDLRDRNPRQGQTLFLRDNARVHDGLNAQGDDSEGGENENGDVEAGQAIDERLPDPRLS